MEIEAIFKTVGIVLAVFAFFIFVYKLSSLVDVSQLTQEGLVKEISLTANAMMKNQGEFETVYKNDFSDFSITANDKDIIVRKGVYILKYPYFGDKNYKLEFETKENTLVMKKVIA